MRTPVAQRLGLAGLALALLLGIGIYARASSTRVASPREPATPQEYLATVLDWVEANSLNIDRVDWPAVRQEAEARAQDARTPADTYPTIRWVLEQLGDRHSFFSEPEQARRSAAGTDRAFGLLITKGVVARVDAGSPAAEAGVREGDVIAAVDGQPLEQVPTWPPAVELTLHRASEPAPLMVRLEAAEYRTEPTPLGQRLAGGIGYVEIPPVLVEHENAAMDAVATRIQRVIREVDQEPTCGWIVDLRRNEGGNMWPMLVGIGPVLGEGEVGMEVWRQREPAAWEYRAGQGFWAGRTTTNLTEAPYTLKQPMPPVAVLTGPNTSSAGEAVTVAFRGRPDTRSFGEPTYGVPTFRAARTFSDGARIDVSAGLDADRTGQTYDDRIAPDQPVAIDWAVFGGEHDPVLQAAATWLRGHPTCRA